MEIVVKNDWQGLQNGINVKELLVCVASDIEGLNVSGIGISAVSFKAGTELVRLDFSTATCVMEESQEETEFGILYRPVIKFDVPRPSAVFNMYVHSIRYSRLAAFVRDGNERWWLTADSLKLAKLKMIGSRTGDTFELFANRRVPTLELIDMSLQDILSDVEFSGEFGSEFNS